MSETTTTTNGGDAALVDAALNLVALNQLTWKPGAVRNAAVRIVKHALFLDFMEFYPDEVPMEGFDQNLGYTSDTTNQNCIGSAYRLLMKAGIIERTGHYRRSTAKDRSGGNVFGLVLASKGKAETFLKRNNATPVAGSQKELGL